MCFKNLLPGDTECVYYPGKIQIQHLLSCVCYCLMMSAPVGLVYGRAFWIFFCFVYFTQKENRKLKNIINI